MNWFFNKKNRKQIEINDIDMPKHIAIIMDGNGRWAIKKHLPRNLGHSAGAKTFKNIVRYCNSINVEYLTVFAFSTENWKRPQSEVDALMNLFESYINDYLNSLNKENIKIRFLGDRSALSQKLQHLINKVENVSSNNTGMSLNIALNYGSKIEIIRTVRLLVDDIKNGKISIDDISEKTFSDRLYTYGQPDVDLVIRTGGEHRISNFMLWQSAYAEYIILDVLWPDFSERDMDYVLKLYSSRNRRFGGL